ncbi:MAG: HNH endonuclease [Anaerolineae bacterium]|nr:HNH endonuclease [Anaerolineae bacterium]
MPAQYAVKSHEVDHIRAEKHGGQTVDSNLCLSCFQCNRHKGSDLTSVDPISDQVVLLFHPRLDIWEDHFVLNGAMIEPLTATGRATVRLLQMNNEDSLEDRQVLVRLGRYP